MAPDDRLEPISLPRALDRDLGESNDNQGSYLVDMDGNPYEPYSLAWRYLGMYIDCDQSKNSWYDLDDMGRKLESGSEDIDDCSRKVLWAAYRDPTYRGGQIGEYQFLDWKRNAWDKSTCETRRCAKMNCHETWSRYRLIGVFKETDGLYDWAEQLFKHEGYCVWDADKEEGSGDGGDDDSDQSDYEFMQNRLESWMGGDCTQMYLTDWSGNTLYLDTKPLPGGNMTYGLYTDDRCSQESTMTFSQYVVKYYATYYYSEDKGYEVAEYWDNVFQRWNELMNAYKVCQPCRAYSIVSSAEDENDEADDNDNDGGGAAESSGYNCYDDAGYRNCNQCYKFETKTNMELASHEDLRRASSQGTILSIRVGSRFYGSGRSASSNAFSLVTVGAFLAVFVVVVGVIANWPSIWNRARRPRCEQPTAIKTVLSDISVGTSNKSLSGVGAKQRHQLRSTFRRLTGNMSPARRTVSAGTKYSSWFRLYTDSDDRS